MSQWSSLLPVVAVAIGGACSHSGSPRSGPGLALSVAPLTLPGIDYACYDVRVVGPDGPVVSLGDPASKWSATDADTLCSWQYGNRGGGDIAYVAPCDADDGDGDGEASNTITVWIDGLYRDPDGDHDRAEDLDIGDWQDPCPDGCDLTVACRENADTEVTFDFTVMRAASQGFFDVGVNFEDVFCSAKLDCRDNLLHDQDGERAMTAVVAFACTAGEGQPTTLYMDDIRVECANNRVYYFDPSQGEGQHGPLPADDETPPFFQTATYLGKEELPGVDKCYWNNALGLDVAALGAGCTLYARATAASVPFGTPNFTSPPNTRYPVVDVAVDLTDGGGTLVCDDAPHPLNGGNGVSTLYGELGGERFTHKMTCGNPPEPGGRLECNAGALTFTQTAAGVVGKVGDHPASLPFDLAPGLSIQACCGDVCCP